MIIRLVRASSSAAEATWLLGARWCICRTPATSPSLLNPTGAERVGDTNGLLPEETLEPEGM